MITAIVCIICLLVLPTVLVYLLLHKFIRRYDMDKYSFSLRCEDMQGEFLPEHVSFYSGKNRLHGYIFGDENEKRKGLVVFCHGLFGGAEEYFAFARHFVRSGYAVFMFDNTGCQRSEGKSIRGALQGLYDLHAAMEYLRTNKSELFAEKTALVGHSWGGFTVAAYPLKDTNIRCVISLAGFNKPAPALCNFISGWFGRNLGFTLPYCMIILLLQYGRRAGISAVDNINKTELPYLAVQGTKDKIIHYNSASLYNYREHVTNPNVKFILRTDERHNKHNTIFRDANATEYMQERYKLMSRANDTEKEKVYTETDRFAINRLDKELTRAMDAFIVSSFHDDNT